MKLRGIHILPWAASAFLLAGGASSPAIASVIDRPFFNARSLVVIIHSIEGETNNEDAANSGTAPVALDFNLLTPAGGGEFDALEASGNLPAFGLDAATDITVAVPRNVQSPGSASRLLIASNAPFDIFAEANNLTKTGAFTSFSYANLGFSAEIAPSGGSGAGAWGSAAQDPSIGGIGIDNAINDLGDISAGPTRFFGGGRRTAQSRGTLLEQTVAFNISYSLAGTPGGGGHAYDLSLGTGTIGAEVVYTVYTL